MTRILFAFAPTLDTHDRFFNCYPSSLLHAIAPLVAEIDAGRIEASYCERIYHPKIYTESAEQLWQEMLLREQPTHLAISSTYDSWHVAVRLSNLARRLLPNVIIIHGGPYLDEVLEPFVLTRTPSLDPLTVDVRECVDFLVAGDGEHALSWLIRVTITACDPTTARARVRDRADEARDLPGSGYIVFTVDDVRFTLKFRNMLDLDALPFIPRHLLPVTDLYDFDCFKDELGGRRPTVTMITHRGCRARCNFCSEGLPYKARSHSHILREARELREAGVEAVFLDDSTIQDNQQLVDLLHGFHELGL